jgi:hypothetical protein
VNEAYKQLAHAKHTTGKVVGHSSKQIPAGREINRETTEWGGGGRNIHRRVEIEPKSGEVGAQREGVKVRIRHANDTQ